MKQFILAVYRFLRSFRLVPKARGRLSPRDLLPFVVVIPIVIYAYASQSIAISETHSTERAARSQYLKSLGMRLSYSARNILATCKDYGHWDEAREIIQTKNPKWIASNLDDGFGVTFGFDIALFQGASGEIVWSKGVTDAVAADIKSYGFLKSCAASKETYGITNLDGRTYICSAACITDSKDRKKPNGMVLAAQRIDKAALADLRAGTPHSLVYLERTGQVASCGRMGAIDKLPENLQDILLSRNVPKRLSVEPSLDERLSYAYAAVLDVKKRPAGTLVDITSRKQVLANIQTIRIMSITLMALCVVFGMAATLYLRTRDLALRASRDELTGLYNHGYLQEFLKAEVARASRYDRSVSVLMLDIDHFKVINDTYGHAAGDQALRVIAEIVVAAVRNTDVVARYGGEELCVVLPETEMDRALLTAERLRSALETNTIHARLPRDKDSDFVDIGLTVSVGASTFPYDGKDSKGIIEAADAALAAAKRTRNAVVAYREIVKDRGSSRKASDSDAFLRDSGISAVRPLVAAIDTRDPGSAHHSEKVAEYAVAIGRELGFSTQDLSLTCKAALVHDVGKLGVPDSVLTKDGRLTAEELESIRRHSKLGADIVAESPQLAPAADIVLHHHERYDGTGYPNGLAGDKIPLISRVITIADVMDAMTSPRSYREPVDLRRVLEELRLQAGKHFDPIVVEAAARVIANLTGTKENRRAA